ncbi:hypothetical protein BG842_07320 [Haladaptatus sp. W1]|nr:hypothetical protein BG842_07320 [Haladaptatus sp. W1]
MGSHKFDRQFWCANSQLDYDIRVQHHLGNLKFKYIDIIKFIFTVATIYLILWVLLVIGNGIL